MNLYPWLSPVLAQLSHALHINRLHHAVLLQGQQGMGKGELSLYLANGVICDGTADLNPCGHCKSCLLFTAGNHPDCLFIRTEGSSIGVDDIRQGGQFIHQTSQISSRRVMLIHNAEKLTEAAANALLKTLEEPNANVYLLLTSDNPARLLATIRSRCFKLGVDAGDPYMVYQWLQQQYGQLDEAQFKRLYSLANTAPLTIRQWLADGKLAVIEQAQSDFQHWLSDNMDTAQYRQKLEQSDFALLLFQHLLIEQVKSQLIAGTGPQGVNRLAQMQSIQAQLGQFNRTRAEILGHNKALALLNLLSGIKASLRE